jgi:hypothetical protein
VNLFSVKKIGVFCDGIRHHNETRKSGDVKVITLQLRVFPFDHKLATALADIVRNTLFKLNHPDPKLEIASVEFKLQTDRQQLLVFASTDTPEASICFDQVKIWHVRSKRRNDATVYALSFDATLGPVGDRELAYAEAWRGTQRAVTFNAAAPNLDFEEVDGGEDDDEADDDTTKTPLPFTGGTCAHGCRLGEACTECDGGTAIAAAAPEDEREAARTIPRRHAAGTKKPQAPRARTH